MCPLQLTKSMKNYNLALVGNKDLDIYYWGHTKNTTRNLCKYVSNRRQMWSILAIRSCQGIKWDMFPTCMCSFYKYFHLQQSCHIVSLDLATSILYLSGQIHMHTYPPLRSKQTDPLIQVPHRSRPYNYLPIFGTREQGDLGEAYILHSWAINHLCLFSQWWD